MTTVSSTRDSIEVHPELKYFRSLDTYLIVGQRVNKENNTLFLTL